jgi:alkanesulfonate monooxygenase SsuD/methylene tetrahydromethanopterin reductase-like flavin-dependent oxidoreductase (luciferase family)
VSTKKGQFKLGAFLLNTGHHVAAWRHPNAWAENGLNFAQYRQLAQTAERAKFDMVFLPMESLCAVMVKISTR